MATFSMAQLGIALGFCKYIMIFYKEQNISSRMRALGELGVELEPYKNLAIDGTAIKDKIVHYVNKTLDIKSHNDLKMG